MNRLWIVHCPRCNNNTTEAVPPKRVNFEPLVHCSLCNAEIDTSKGHFVLASSAKSVEKVPDLLEVE